MKILIISFSLIAILFNSSLAQDTSCGILWEPPIQLTDTSYSAYMPKIALSGDDTIHVTWTEDYAKHNLPYCRSVTGGASWEEIVDLAADNSYRFWYSAIIAEGNNTYIFACNEGNINKPILMRHSSDGGSIWSQGVRISSDTALGIFSANLHHDTLVLIYSAEKNGFSQKPRLIFSIDSGKTWTHTKDTLDGWTRTALTPGTLHLVRDVFVGGAQEKLYMRSFDLGNTWVDKETLSTVDGKWSYEHAVAASVAENDTTVMIAWRDAKLGCFSGYGLGCSIIERESNDDGNHWMDEEILTNDPKGLNPAVDLNDSSAVIVWYHDVQLEKFHLLTRVRRGRFNNWCEAIDLTPFTEYAGATALPAVAISRKAIHVLWQEMIGDSIRRSQIFYRRGVFLTTDVKEEKNNISGGYSLSQNYPNPFNPKTNFGFRISDFGFVSLKVYDVFGREVATLVNEKKQPGEYEVEWNADGFASGVYFYRLTNYDSRFTLRTETKKAILMK